MSEYQLGDCVYKLSSYHPFEMHTYIVFKKDIEELLVHTGSERRVKYNLKQLPSGKPVTCYGTEIFKSSDDLRNALTSLINKGEYNE